MSGWQLLTTSHLSRIIYHYPLKIAIPIPEILENPVIVQFSDAIDEKTGKQKYDSRITVLGDLFANLNGSQKPVLVSLELLPRKGLEIRDFSIITSAYGHSKLNHYLSENSILYIDPDKKRTNGWLSRTRLQLPVGENQFGSIRKITYSGEKVKIQNPIHMTQMQEKLFRAGVIDEYGNPINLSGKKSKNDAFYFDDVESLKERQNSIVQQNNSMHDDYHTGIRGIEDIYTFEEALENGEYEEGEDFSPDYTWRMAQRAVSSGKITVYSSYPIKQGVFVTPSKRKRKLLREK